MLTKDSLKIVDEALKNIYSGYSTHIAELILISKSRVLTKEEEKTLSILRELAIESESLRVKSASLSLNTNHLSQYA